MTGCDLVNSGIDRLLAKGKAIVCFQADGCMAHDHKFQWYGVIESFHKQDHGDPIMLAVVDILKRKDDPNDGRDGNLGTETVYAGKISLLTGLAYIIYT